MTDEDFEWCDVCEDCDCYKAIGDFKYRCMLEGGRCQGYFAYKKLESENAALRERLSHSLELPYMEQTVSQYGTEDTVLYYMENGKLQQECFNNKFPEQLQAKLAELKGEEKDG